MRKIVLPVITCLIALNSIGQDADRKNALSLKLGMVYIARQDLVFSPLIHTDLSLMNPALEYTREGNIFHKVHIDYANFNPMVSEPYEFADHGETEMANPHNITIVNIDYLIGKKVKETMRSTFIAGGLLTANVQAANFVYGRISSFGYYSAFGLGVFGRKEVSLSEKGKVSAALQFPIVTWLARSPYLVNDDEFIENISSHSGLKSFMAFIGDGGLVTWNKLQTFDLEIDYKYRLNEKFELGTAYLFEFSHANSPRNFLFYSNTLIFSGTFRF